MCNNFKERLENIWQKIGNRFNKIDARGKIPYQKNRLKTKGHNNKIFVIKNGSAKPIYSWNFSKYLKNLEIIIKGNNNTLKIHLPTRFIETKIILSGSNNSMEIGSTNYKIDRSTIRATNGASLIIGNNLSVSRDLDLIASGKDTFITIGNDCMLSGGIKIMNNDGHIMHDKAGDLLTKPGNINIGNHIWLGLETIILKNTNIPDGCMVGIRSLINKKFTKTNVILAGSPAKICKEEITWSRDATV